MKTKNLESVNKRISYVHTINMAVDKAAKSLYKTRGFANFKLITDWHYIIGTEYAKVTNPKKISYLKDKAGAILYIEIYDSAAAMELSYIENEIIERIATYFGYKAIDKIKFLQKPLKLKRNDESVYRKIPNNYISYNKDIEAISDDKLRMVLRSFATTMSAKQ